jgi:chromosome condensin MukBEF MukE localization factor
MGYEASKFEFLDSDDSEENFANCDFALKSGKHIQNHHHEYRLYEYISNNFEELVHLYRKLYGVVLKRDEFHDQTYFYIDFDSDSRGKFTGTKSDKLSSRHTLFGLLLLKIYRVDNYFGRSEISVLKLKEQLKNDNNNYRDDIYRLFAKVANRNNASETDEGNIHTWIENSLKRFDELGWIYFDNDDNDLFTVLPSFNRLFKIYVNEIRDFEKLTGTEVAK